MSLAQITNKDFLCGGFDRGWKDVLVASFPGDPNNVQPGAWRVWRAGRFVPDDAGANNYFCPSTFHPGPNGAPRRRKDLHNLTYLIVVDDVGEKLTANELRAKLGEPTYRVSTSQKSEQWGYKLELPEPNAARVEALLDGIVKDPDINPSGVDPGMKGLTRLVRLPVGQNGKAKYGRGGVACRSCEWAPERVFTMEELADGIGLDLASVAPGAGRPRHNVHATGQDHILDLLNELGAVKHEIEKGKWEITCPFVGTHGDQIDDGAAYLGDGCFKCHHRCEALRSQDFRSALDVAARTAGLRTLGAREFADADTTILGRLREHLDGGHPLSRDEVGQLALVPRLDVQSVFRAGQNATRAVEQRALRRRVNRRRHKLGHPSTTRRAHKPDRLARAEYRPAVSLDEVRAAQRALVQAAIA